jgi:hypothetical protein
MTDVPMNLSNFSSKPDNEASGSILIWWRRAPPLPQRGGSARSWAGRSFFALTHLY